jgi:hypothetical protein
LKKPNVNLEIKSHTKYEKKPLKTPTSITKIGYVPNGRKKRFQDYRCGNVGSQ